ncbi:MULTISPECIES: TetR/AcrR family transcriptional regulator [Actinomadura]|uniref:DNA-binding transcriptional regulator, AcrR family n=1 Tax=Actinomadura madurae TaxID=1993 RepID=A0A1I5JTE2_9ACTN|nr:TetR/AcrR family transcriptional regulator [Actinomadura madurae]SFO75691.1 DNA-binding transcriptional regulator, AcrR family [Actinomadura madurae]SPT64249.1 HTH-type transcriptional repressor KstR2 [Actinomadura madurae]
MSRSTVIRDHVRAGILEVAAGVLAERGESASMTDIAKAAGVARATLYRYFPSREALLYALYEAALTDLTDRLEDARLDAVPIEEAVARMTRATIAATSRYRALGLFEKSPAEARRVERQLAGPLRAVFERGAKGGCFRGDLPVHTLAELYFSLLEGVVSRVIRHRLGVEEASAAVTTVFLSGALAPPPDGPARRY